MSDDDEEGREEEVWGWRESIRYLFGKGEEEEVSFDVEKVEG